MGDELTIRQAAIRTGLSEHTLRYYERAKLLEPVGRASNGHRLYAAADLVRIELLNRMRATGMPIRRMQQFALLRRQGEDTVAARLALLSEHRAAVKEHIENLQRNLAVIEEKIHYYEEMEAQHENGKDEIRTRPGPDGGGPGPGG